jgi:hypothetical protein
MLHHSVRKDLKDHSVQQHLKDHITLQELKDHYAQQALNDRIALQDCKDQNVHIGVRAPANMDQHCSCIAERYYFILCAKTSTAGSIQKFQSGFFCTLA